MRINHLNRLQRDSSLQCCLADFSEHGSMSFFSKSRTTFIFLYGDDEN